MRDPVTDVLAERARLDGGAAAGVTAALLLHGGAAALVIYAALHQPPPAMTANVLNIKFAPPAAPPPPPAHATPAPPRAGAPAPVAPPAIVPPPPAPPAAKPVPKNTAPPDAFGRSTKKPGELAPPPAPPRASAPATPTPTGVQPAAPVTDTIAAGTSGVTGLEGGDFPYTIYIENMRRLIGSHWFRPQGASATATVHFVINRDGTIRDAVLETASGTGSLNSAFDRAALRAVIETSPLPPLPFAYSGTYLGVHLTFR